MRRSCQPAIALALIPAFASAVAEAQSPQPRPQTELRLSADAILSIGSLDGPEETLFAGINAGARLSDGSVVLSDRAQFRIQRFGSGGSHLWSRGRKGEGPGEFEYPRIVDGCAREDSIVIYDVHTQRFSIYDGAGNIVDERRFLYNGLPLRGFACAPNGRVAFLGNSVRMGEEGLEPGELFRELLSLGTARIPDPRGDTVTTTLRERIRSSEYRYLGPGDAMPGSLWAHEAVIAATDGGVWMGTGDDYEVELIDWAGATIRRIRWEGPELSVTREDIDAYREALAESYRDDSDPGWRARFESRWEWESEIVPEAFPAYVRILAGHDGTLCVHDYTRPGEPSEWFGFDRAGRWIRVLALPERTTLLDIGQDWALVRTVNELGVQRVEVRGVAEAR